MKIYLRSLQFGAHLGSSNGHNIWSFNITTCSCLDLHTQLHIRQDDLDFFMNISIWVKLHYLYNFLYFVVDATEGPWEKQIPVLPV